MHQGVYVWFFSIYHAHLHIALTRTPSRDEIGTLALRMIQAGSGSGRLEEATWLQPSLHQTLCCHLSLSEQAGDSPNYQSLSQFPQPRLLQMSLPAPLGAPLSREMNGVSGAGAM